MAETQENCYEIGEEKSGTVNRKPEKKVLLGPDAVRHFYKNVRAYKIQGKTTDLNVGELFPGEPDEVVADKLSAHLN